MDYNRSCYWQSGPHICGHHRHTGALPRAFLRTLMCWGWTHGRCAARLGSARISRRLSPPTGVLCVRGRTCVKPGKSARRRAADLPRGSGGTEAKDDAPLAALTWTVFSGKGEGLWEGDEFADRDESKAERRVRISRYSEFKEQESALHAPTSSFR